MVLQCGWLFLVQCYKVDGCYWYGATLWMTVFGMVLQCGLLFLVWCYSVDGCFGMVLQCGWLFLVWCYKVDGLVWYGATVWIALFDMVLRCVWLFVVWCYSVDGCFGMVLQCGWLFLVWCYDAGNSLSFSVLQCVAMCCNVLHVSVKILYCVKIILLCYTVLQCQGCNVSTWRA